MRFFARANIRHHVNSAVAVMFLRKDNSFLRLIILILFFLQISKFI